MHSHMNVKRNRNCADCYTNLRKLPIICTVIKTITVFQFLKSYSNFQCFAVALLNTECCV